MTHRDEDSIFETKNIKSKYFGIFLHSMKILKSTSDEENEENNKDLKHMGSSATVVLVHAFDRIIL